MTRPAMSYRLRSSGGLVSALLVAGAHLNALLASGRPWRGDFLWAVQELGEPVLLLVPAFLVLATTPLVTRGGTVTETALMPVSPTRAHGIRWLVEAAPPLAVHLAFVLVVLGLCRANGSPVHASALLTVGAQVLTIVVMTALGQVVAQAWHHVGATLVSAAIGIFLIGFASNAFRVDAGDSPYAGLRLQAGPYLAALGVLLVAAAVAGWALLRAARRVPSVVVAIALVATFATSAVAVGSPQTEPSGAVPDRCSARAGVRTCMFDGYQRMLAPTEAVLSSYVTALEGKGVVSPMREVFQVTPGAGAAQAHRGYVQFQPSELTEARVQPDTVLMALLTPVWCERLFSGEPLSDATYERTSLVAAWLQVQTGRMSAAEFRALAPALAQRPETEQVETVKQFFAEQTTCAEVQ